MFACGARLSGFNLTWMRFPLKNDVIKIKISYLDHPKLISQKYLPIWTMLKGHILIDVMEVRFTLVVKVLRFQRISGKKLISFWT